MLNAVALTDFSERSIVKTFSRFLTPVLLFSCCASMAVSVSAQQSQKEFLNWAVEQTGKIDFESELNHRESIYVLTEIAISCGKRDKPELAQTFLNHAETIAKNTEGTSYYFSLFRCAIELGQLDKATEIAGWSGNAKNGLLDRVDLERYRRTGDLSALKDFPRKPIDFFDAGRLAKIYVELGDFEAAEEFVTDLIAKQRLMFCKRACPRLSAWSMAPKETVQVQCHTCRITFAEFRQPRSPFRRSRRG